MWDTDLAELLADLAGFVRVPAFGFWVLGFGVFGGWVLGFGFWALGFGFGGLGFGA